LIRFATLDRFKTPQAAAEPGILDREGLL